MPDVQAFLAAPKTMSQPVSWVSRGRNAADIAQVPVEEGGRIVGDLIAVQNPGAPRHWSFKLRIGGQECLRWDYLPHGSLRRHRNRGKAVPAGLPAVDRSLIHEHPFEDHDRYSRPLPEQDTNDHRQAFAWFCDRANIDPDAVYRDPPEPQLTLLT